MANDDLLQTVTMNYEAACRACIDILDSGPKPLLTLGSRLSSWTGDQSFAEYFGCGRLTDFLVASSIFKLEPPAGGNSEPGKNGWIASLNPNHRTMSNPVPRSILLMAEKAERASEKERDFADKPSCGSAKQDKTLEYKICGEFAGAGWVTVGMDMAPFVRTLNVIPRHAAGKLNSVLHAWLADRPELFDADGNRVRVVRNWQTAIKGARAGVGTDAKDRGKANPPRQGDFIPIGEEHTDLLLDALPALLQSRPGRRAHLGSTVGIYLRDELGLNGGGGLLRDWVKRRPDVFQIRDEFLEFAPRSASPLRPQARAASYAGASSASPSGSAQYEQQQPSYPRGGPSAQDTLFEAEVALLLLTSGGYGVPLDELTRSLATEPMKYEVPGGVSLAAWLRERKDAFALDEGANVVRLQQDYATALARRGGGAAGLVIGVAARAKSTFDAEAQKVSQLRTQLERIMQGLARHSSDLSDAAAERSSLAAAHTQLQEETAALRREVAHLQAQLAVPQVQPAQELAEPAMADRAAASIPAPATRPAPAEATLVGERLQLVGGSDAGLTFTGDVYEWKSCVNEWRPLTALPGIRAFAGAEAVGSRLYALGGGNSKGDWFQDTLCLDLAPGATPTWQPCGVLSSQRGSMGTGVSGGRIYVFGGGMAHTQFGSTEWLEPSRETWMPGPELTVPRFACAGTHCGGVLYAAAGYGGPDAGYHGTLERLDPRDPAGWALLPGSLRVPRGSLGTAILGGVDVYALGGQSDVTRADVEVYDTRAAAWRSVAPLLSPRAYVNAAVIDGVLHAVGGLETKDGSMVLQPLIERYDPGTDTWEVLDLGPSALAGAAFSSVTVMGP